VACDRAAPPPVVALSGALTVEGASARLTACRPGHGVHVFVDVDTSLGTLRFGEGKLAWNGRELACDKLDRIWGGGVRRDGSAYFRGTLAFRCGRVVGDLALDCGDITTEEATELARNRAAARASGSVGEPAAAAVAPVGAGAVAPEGAGAVAPEDAGSAAAGVGSTGAQAVAPAAGSAAAGAGSTGARAVAPVGAGSADVRAAGSPTH